MSPLVESQTYNARKVNELLNAEAKRLGLDAGDIWDQYLGNFPSCTPGSRTSTSMLAVQVCYFIKNGRWNDGHFRGENVGSRRSLSNGTLR